jgi:hypothetical protein
MPSDSLQVCYFGDHLISDIFVPRKYGYRIASRRGGTFIDHVLVEISLLKWHTVAIVEEMEHYHMDNIDRTPSEVGEELLHAHNSYWGSFFHTPAGKSTFWQQLLKDFATLCVPCTSHFIAFRPGTY